MTGVIGPNRLGFRLIYFFKPKRCEFFTDCGHQVEETTKGHERYRFGLQARTAYLIRETIPTEAGPRNVKRDEVRHQWRGVVFRVRTDSSM